MFADLFKSTDGGGEGEHWGHIECNCGHRANETLEEAKTRHRIHLNGRCKWSCCGANWSDMLCTAAVTKEASTSSMDVDTVGDKKDDDSVSKKFRRFLPTFYTEELICLSCFKPYKNPVKLPCGHTVCAECLRKLAAYQKAAGSFSSRFRVTAVKPEDAAAAAMEEEDDEIGNLRLRQMTRTQRRLLLSDDSEKKETSKKDKKEDEFVVCPVCSQTSLMSSAVEDLEIIDKMKQLSEQRSKGTKPKCAFCTSAVLAGSQPDEASEATLMCSTCGPICARHHALLHIAGPPTFRCHEVSEKMIDLLPMNVIPRHYEICAKHGCEKDLYDKKTKTSLCEVCASGLPKKDIGTRIIREEDKMAFITEEDTKAKKRVALEKKSKEDQLLEQERAQKKQIASLQEDLATTLKKCSETLEESQKLHAAGALTRNAEGINETREEIRQLFAEGHETLNEMEKQAQREIDRLIENADELLTSRYSAAQAVLRDAQESSSRIAGVTIDTPDIRGMVIRRLQDILKSLQGVSSLPAEPQKASNLFTLNKQPDAVKMLHIASVTQAENGLFSSAASSSAAAEPEEPQPPMEDDDTILERIRAKLKSQETESQRSRENSRYATVKSSVNSGMDDDMKREAIGAILFDRGESVLSASFEEVIMVTECFLEKNSLDHILDDLSSPADFNREMRAIYAFLKETKAIA